MEILRKVQPWLGARLTVMPEFAGRVAENVVALARRGIRHFIVGYATGAGWTAEDAARLGKGLQDLYDWWRREPPGRRPVLQYIREARRPRRANRRHAYGCRAGRTGIAVDTDGVLYPCSKLIGANGGRGVLPLGDVREGITDHETRATLCGYRPVDRAGCWTCALQDRCHGGCYAVNHALTGHPFRAGPECVLVRTFRRVEAYIRDREGRDVDRFVLDRWLFAPQR